MIQKMVFGFVVLLALFNSINAHATGSVQSMVATGPSGEMVRLFKETCAGQAAAAVVKVFTSAEMSQVAEFQRAKATLEGKDYEACWLADPRQDVVVIVFDDGDVGLIPMAAFKPDRGV